MEKSIGALWVATNDKGEFWKGNIELPDGTKQNIIVFKNSYKKDKQPDLRIYKSKQKEQQEQTEIMSEDSLPF